MRAAIGVLISGLLAPLLAGDEGVAFAPGGLVREYCIDCHDARRGEGGLDFGRHLDGEGRADPIADYRLWYRVADEVAAGRMPPEDEYRPPRAEAEAWARQLRARLDRHAARHDGAVGGVPLRRVSNAEYASLVRRATGLDLDGAFAGLPVDPALGAGFRNHALDVTATHLREFVAIADAVARRALLLEDRIVFVDREIVDVNAREAVLEDRVRAVHRRYRTDDGRLPLAAHLAALDGELPADCSPHYQEHLRTWLAAHRDGPIGSWVVERLRAADGDPAACASLADEMLALAASLARDLPDDGVREVGRSWREGRARRFLRVAPGQLRDALPVRLLVTPHRSRMATRTVWEDGALHLFARAVGFHAAVWGDADCELRLEDPILVPRDGDPDDDGVALRAGLPAAPAGCRWDGDALLVPAGGGWTIDDRAFRERYADWSLRATVGLAAPAAPTMVQIRARPDREGPGPVAGLPLLAPADEDRARALRRAAAAYLATVPARVLGAIRTTTGEANPLQPYHLRDDAAYAALMLDEAERAELDARWDDLLFAGRATAYDLWRCYHWASKRSLLVDWSEAHLLDEATFARFRAIDRDALAPADRRLIATGAQVRDRRERHRAWEARRRAADGRRVGQLVAHAGAWWGRNVDEALRARIAELFTELRAVHDADAATREVLVYLLSAPELVLVRPPPAADAPDRGPRLARRLALALWGAPPDVRLRRLAAAGDLDDPEILAAEVRRLVADPHADFFVEECLGRWLGWADLSRRPPFDRSAWPAVDDALLAQMRASCRRTVGEALRRDRPVAELLDTPWRWLTPELAAHEGRELDGEGWRRVAHDDGLLSLPGLLAPLTTGARGSVVRRGAWVHRDLLGRHLPRPPEGVDPLPAEDPEEPVGIRARIAAHMEQASCRACHGRFDRYGFAFEGLDGLGRPRDDARVDDLVVLPGDAEVRGLAGLREYLGAHRGELVEQALRKVLGYALGRRIVLSDEPLIARTLARMRDGEGRWSELLVAVFTAPQWTGAGGLR